MISISKKINEACEYEVFKMGTPATEAKQRWNTEHYAQVKISVAPELASAFKIACAVQNVSITGAISQFMVEYSDSAIKGKPSPDYETKRKRRTAMKSIIRQLEQIKDAEEQSRDNIPENLQGSSVFDTADQCVSLLEESIALLESIY